jgi:hypothetical protein
MPKHALNTKTRYMMTKLILWNPIIIVIVVGFPALWPAIETRAQQPLIQPRSGGETHISDRELRMFAKAYAEIHGVVAAYEPSLQTSRDPEQVERIMQEAEHKIERLLEAHAFTADSFLKIAAVINADDELRMKTLAMINEERKKTRA